MCKFDAIWHTLIIKWKNCALIFISFYPLQSLHISVVVSLFDFVHVSFNVYLSPFNRLKVMERKNKEPIAVSFCINFQKFSPSCAQFENTLFCIHNNLSVYKTCFFFQEFEYYFVIYIYKKKTNHFFFVSSELKAKKFII